MVKASSLYPSNCLLFLRLFAMLFTSAGEKSHRSTAIVRFFAMDDLSERRLSTQAVLLYQ